MDPAHCTRAGCGLDPSLVSSAGSSTAQATSPLAHSCATISPSRVASPAAISRARSSPVRNPAASPNRSLARADPSGAKSRTTDSAQRRCSRLPVDLVRGVQRVPGGRGGGHAKAWPTAGGARARPEQYPVWTAVPLRSVHPGMLKLRSLSPAPKRISGVRLGQQAVDVLGLEGLAMFAQD